MSASVQSEIPVWFSFGFCEMRRMNCFESVSAMSVDRFDAVSVMYWLIQRGSFARLSARANLCAAP